MIETTVQNPEKQETLRADSQGRVNLGIDYAGQTVEVIVADASRPGTEGTGIQQSLSDPTLESYKRTAMLFIRSFGISTDHLVDDHNAVIDGDEVDPETVESTDIDWEMGHVGDSKNAARFVWDSEHASSVDIFTELTERPSEVTAVDEEASEPVYVYTNEAGGESALSQRFVDFVQRIYGYGPDELHHLQMSPETSPCPVKFMHPDGETFIVIAPRIE